MDFVGKRYGRLPSELLESGSTIDIHCALLGQQYENYAQRKATKISNGEAVDHKLSQDQMRDMLQRVRDAKKNNKQNRS